METAASRATEMEQLLAAKQHTISDCGQQRDALQQQLAQAQTDKSDVDQRLTARQDELIAALKHQAEDAAHTGNLKV